MTQILIVLILGFFAWMLYVGWKTHRGKTQHDVEENFLIGNRSISGWLVAIGTTMGWVDAFQFGVSPGLAMDLGWASIAYIAGVTFSFLFLMAFAGKIRRQAAETGSYMMGNYFSRHFSPRVSAIVGVVMVVYFFIWLSVQFSIGGQVLAQVTNIPLAPIAIAMGIVALLYMLMGGFLASIRTDLIQFIIFIVFAVVMLILWVPHVPEWSPPVATFHSQSLFESITMFVLNLASTIAAPDVWQRIYSARSDREAKKSMAVLSVMMTVMLLFFIMLGMILKGMGFSTNSQTAAGDIFTHLIPAWFLPAAVIAFMAAIMSTIATCVFGTSMTLASDVAAELKWVSHENLAKLCRWLMAVVLIAALVLAFMNVDILTLAFTSLAVTEVVLPLLLLALFGVKVSEIAAFWGIFLSLIAFAVGAYYNIYTGPLALAPLGVASVVTLVLEMGVRVVRRGKRDAAVV